MFRKNMYAVRGSTQDRSLRWLQPSQGGAIRGCWVLNLQRDLLATSKRLRKCDGQSWAKYWVALAKMNLHKWWKNPSIIIIIYWFSNAIVTFSVVNGIPEVDIPIGKTQVMQGNWGNTHLQRFWVRSFWIQDGDLLDLQEGSIQDHVWYSILVSLEGMRHWPGDCFEVPVYIPV
jgi:hypothetical protein